MNSKERLDKFVSGEKTDRRPNLSIVQGFCARYLNITIDEYCKDYNKLVEAAIKAARDLELDGITIGTDTCREAQGFGSTVTYHKDKAPTILKPGLIDIEDVKNLKAPRVKDMPELYDLVIATKEAMKKEPNIYTFTQATGPFTSACNVRGVKEFMMDMFRKPDLAKKLIEIITDSLIDYIDELADIGAKYILIADLFAGTISPKQFKDVVLESHNRLFDQIKSKGMIGRLQICGNTENLLEFTSKTGAKIIDIDHDTNYKNALGKVGDSDVIINGNLDISDIYVCKPEEIVNIIIELDSEVGRHHCLYMPGCEIPIKTKTENVRAIAEGLKKVSY